MNDNIETIAMLVVAWRKVLKGIEWRKLNERDPELPESQLQMADYVAKVDECVKLLDASIGGAGERLSNALTINK